jgi:hypothetical protein
MGTREGREPHKGRYFTLSSGQDLVDKVDKVTREENSTKSVLLVTKIVPQKTIVRIKSFLSIPSTTLRTSLPCLPGLAFTDYSYFQVNKSHFDLGFPSTM